MWVGFVIFWMILEHAVLWLPIILIVWAILQAIEGQNIPGRNQSDRLRGRNGRKESYDPKTDPNLQELDDDDKNWIDSEEWEEWR